MNFKNITRLYIKVFSLDNIKFYLKILYWAIILFSIGLIISNIYYILFNGVILCDSIDITSSGDPQHEEKASGVTDSNYYIERRSGAFLKYKYILSRRLFWFFQAKGSGKFNSYEEFEKTLDDKFSLRSEFKARFREAIRNPISDFKQTRRKAASDLQKSLDLDVKSTEGIRNAKRAVDMKRLERSWRINHNKK